MWFGAVTLDEAAVGAVLVHTHRLPGQVMRKGVPLTIAGIAALRAAGLESVVAARLAPDDVGEDAAADRIARAAAGPGLHLSNALTGRCNLHAMVRGVFGVDRARVDALNRHGWERTLDTAEPDKVAEPVALFAAVTVISFTVSELVLRVVDAVAAHVELLLDAWQRSSASIVVPFAGGRRGNPVLFAAEHLPALRQCEGDVGARALVVAEPRRVEAVSIDHIGVLRDIDTPADLASRRAARPEPS